MEKARKEPGDALVQAGITPVAPGVFLARRILDPQQLQLEDAAKAIGLSKVVLRRLLDQKQPVDNEIAQLLATYTGTTPEFWVRMQAAADRVAR